VTLSLSDRFSIVTPSFNQAPYINTAIRSVLDQQWPALDYVVMDGGSTDGSVDHIAGHASRLLHWQSARDDGQYAAVNDGFARTQGGIMGWINADDCYLPWTFSVVAEIFQQFQHVDWITAAYQLLMDERGRAVGCARSWGSSRKAFFAGDNLPQPGQLASGWIQQEATFWRRSLWDRAGGLDPSWRLAGDFELWCRFYQHAELWAVATPLAAFRQHGQQRSQLQRTAYLEEAERALVHHGGRRWNRLRAALEVGLKRSAPRQVRRVAQMAGLVGPCGLIRHDPRADRWIAEWV
jgi:hypothetical protein